MRHIGVTGPRELTREHWHKACRELLKLELSTFELVHVGDAAGLDELARVTARGVGACVELHQQRTDLPFRARGAERSTRMIKALAKAGGALHAWSNKLAPEGLKPSKSWPKNANGSGTWGTIALAKGLGIEVVVHKLGEFDLPNWLEEDFDGLTARVGAEAAMLKLF